MNETIFDKILAGDIPCDKVYEDETVLAFRDINPKAPVHVIVIPKKKIERFSDFNNQDPLITGRFIQKVAFVAQELSLNKGYRVVFNCGEEGGQEVEYIHAHIFGGKKLKFSVL